jgi:hypothetical protein
MPLSLRAALACRAAAFATALGQAGAALAQPRPAALPAPAAAASAAEPSEPTAPTGAGQRIYERIRPQLLQVRTLLKTQDSQSSVGSGFLVDDAGHLITNYHVISQYALRPSQHRLVYATVDGRQGALQLLAFDVVHDLALLKPVDPAPLAGRGSVPIRPANEPLPRGARIYSMGNPLDVGFAVAEGSFNGPVERSYLPTLFFGGSLSSGMSGGPALDDNGRLVGVNVAARRDGEQVSFLVPADPVRLLISRGRGASPIVAPAWDEVARQLGEHETRLTADFISQPWRNAGHPLYRIPVPQETWMRCWGRSSPAQSRGLQFERSDCEMDSRVFVAGPLLTGYITVRHEAYDGSRIGAWRFSERHSSSFGNEFVGIDDRLRTAAQCRERTIVPPAAPGTTAKAEPPLPLRAVVCLRAYKKLPGLHDLMVLVATLDGRTVGVQGRLDAFGVGLASAERLTRHYLAGFGRSGSATEVPK